MFRPAARNASTTPLARHQIPSAEYQNFTEVEPALAYLREKGAPIVILGEVLVFGTRDLMAGKKIFGEGF
jgi:phosphoribosylamine-glycine ligase